MPEPILNPVVLQASEHVRFEANDVAELTELVTLWKRDLFPYLFDDVDPTQSKSGRGALPPKEAPPATLPGASQLPDGWENYDERQLAALHVQVVGKRFFYKADCGLTRGDALVAAIRAA